MLREKARSKWSGALPGGGSLRRAIISSLRLHVVKDATRQSTRQYLLVLGASPAHHMLLFIDAGVVERPSVMPKTRFMRMCKWKDPNRQDMQAPEDASGQE